MKKNQPKQTHKEEFQIHDRKYMCPFEVTASIIQGKWKMKILKTLCDEKTLRYGELKNLIRGNITHKMLIQSLRELEDDGIVLRTMYPEVPPKVEYTLTKEGIRLKSVIDQMNQFGFAYKV